MSLFYHFSGIDFDGPTVGLAFIGTLCTGHSTGVIQVTKSPDVSQKFRKVSKIPKRILCICLLFLRKSHDISATNAGPLLSPSGP